MGPRTVLPYTSGCRLLFSVSEMHTNILPLHRRQPLFRHSRSLSPPRAAQADDRCTSPAASCSPAHGLRRPARLSVRRRRPRRPLRRHRRRAWPAQPNRRQRHRTAEANLPCGDRCPHKNLVRSPRRRAGPRQQPALTADSAGGARLSARRGALGDLPAIVEGSVRSGVSAVRRGRTGFAWMREQSGMWRAPAVALKRRRQVGHSTKVGSSMYGSCEAGARGGAARGSRVRLEGKRSPFTRNHPARGPQRTGGGSGPPEARAACHFRS